MGKLDPYYVDDSEADMRGLSEAGWYLLDDNGNIADGPFSSREQAAKAAKTPD